MGPAVASGLVAHFTLAAWVIKRARRRVLAFVLDGLLMVPLSFGVETALDAPRAGALIWLIPYRMVAHALFGQTLGKKWLGLSVHDITGRHLKVGQLVRRAIWLVGVACWPLPLVVATPSGHMLAISLIVGFTASTAWLVTDAVFVGFTEGKRALHDYIGGTEVAGEEKAPSSRD